MGGAINCSLISAHFFISTHLIPFRFISTTRVYGSTPATLPSRPRCMYYYNECTCTVYREYFVVKILSDIIVQGHLSKNCSTQIFIERFRNICTRNIHDLQYTAVVLQGTYKHLPTHYAYRATSTALCFSRMSLALREKFEASAPSTENTMASV